MNQENPLRTLKLISTLIVIVLMAGSTARAQETNRHLTNLNHISLLKSVLPETAYLASAQTSLASDGINNAFGSSAALGTLGCGQTMSLKGTTFPSATEDWFAFAWNPGPVCSKITLTLTASSGIQFDVRTNYTTNVAAAATTAVSLTTAGTYYIRIYGATPSVTGTWAMALAVSAGAPAAIAHGTTALARPGPIATAATVAPGTVASTTTRAPGTALHASPGPIVATGITPMQSLGGKMQTIPPTQTTLTPDGINNSFNSAVHLGTLVCGENLSINGTTFPAATEDWFVATWSPGSTCTEQLHLSLKATRGIQYDVRTNFATNVAAAATGAVFLPKAGTYYVRIYGAAPSVTGTWMMTMQAISPDSWVQ